MRYRRKEPFSPEQIFFRPLRAGTQVQVSLAVAEDLAEGKSAGLLALDDALRALAAVNQQQSRIVELCFYHLSVSIELEALSR